MSTKYSIDLYYIRRVHGYMNAGDPNTLLVEMAFIHIRDHWCDLMHSRSSHVCLIDANVKEKVKEGAVLRARQCVCPGAVIGGKGMLFLTDTEVLANAVAPRNILKGVAEGLGLEGLAYGRGQWASFAQTGFFYDHAKYSSRSTPSPDDHAHAQHSAHREVYAIKASGPVFSYIGRGGEVTSAVSVVLLQHDRDGAVEFAVTLHGQDAKAAIGAIELGRDAIKTPRITAIGADFAVDVRGSAREGASRVPRYRSTVTKFKTKGKILPCDPSGTGNPTTLFSTIYSIQAIEVNRDKHCGSKSEGLSLVEKNEGMADEELRDELVREWKVIVIAKIWKIEYVFNQFRKGLGVWETRVTLKQDHGTQTQKFKTIFCDLIWSLRASVPCLADRNIATGERGHPQFDMGRKNAKSEYSDELIKWANEPHHCVVSIKRAWWKREDGWETRLDYTVLSLGRKI